MLTNPLQTIAISALIGLFVGGYTGYQYNDGQHAIQSSIEERATNEANASMVRSARTVEQEAVKNDVSASKNYQDGLNNGKKDLDAALAKLRSERVRNRTSASASMPANSTATSGCNDEARSDVFEQMARLAAEADDVTRQLTAAQDVLNNRTLMAVEK